MYVWQPVVWRTYSVEHLVQWTRCCKGRNILRISVHCAFTKELLRTIVKNKELNNMAGLENLLVNLSTKSRTTKAWTELVIKPTLLIMQFTRATHEHDYDPYFFAAHKHNYARYCLSICCSLTWLPSEVKQQILHCWADSPSEWYSIRPIHQNHMDEARKGSERCHWKHAKLTDSGNVVL